MLLQVPFLPLLGAVADRSEAKRRLLVRGTAVGVVATLLLAAVPLGSPLPRLGLRRRGLLLALALLVVLFHARLGLSKSSAGRVAIASAALWWGAFGALLVQRLRARHLHDPRNRHGPPGPLSTPAGSVDHGAWGSGDERDQRSAVAQLRDSLLALQALPGTARFLLSFLLFNDAIQAVVGLSAIFLTQELYVSKGLQESDVTTFLLTLVLLIQVVAVPGAWLSARLAGQVGTKAVPVGKLVVWIGVVLFAVTGLQTTTSAYGLGVAIALVLGGTQSLARSLFSRMVPAGRQASFFGFYELAERGTARIGSLIFAVVLELTGDYRGALLSLLPLFVAGGLLLVRTDTDAAVTAASVAGPDGRGQGVQLGQVVGRQDEVG